jgi:hypothetical protein
LDEELQMAEQIYMFFISNNTVMEKKVVGVNQVVENIYNQ